MNAQIPFDPDFDQKTNIVEPALSSRTMFMFGMGTALVVGSLLGNFILIKLIIK